MITVEVVIISTLMDLLFISFEESRLQYKDQRFFDGLSKISNVEISKLHD